MLKMPSHFRKKYFLSVLIFFSGLFAIGLSGCSTGTSTQTTHGAPAYKSAYVGQEGRTIKNLSEKDIDSLLAGKGWGFAKAAELNGVPGPAHLLEMKEQIQLTRDQIEKIEQIRNKMKKDAMRLGRKFIKLEEKLNRQFAKNTMNSKNLRSLLLKIGKVRSELRYTHLATHLQTPALLTPQQITHYSKLRGYSLKKNTRDAPPAHNPAMHKNHQG